MVVNINMDMVGRQDEKFPQGIYVLGSEKRSAELKELLIATNEATVKLPLDFGFDQNDPESWWTRSDQVGFHNKGIPVIFFTSGDHPDYHQTTDDAEKIDFEKVRGVSQLCYEMAMTLGNREARPAMKAK
jgi:Zn-dependent M28 family amino/carboxypeptidase